MHIFPCYSDSVQKCIQKGTAENQPLPFCVAGKELSKLTKPTPQMHAAARLLARGLGVKEVAARVRRREETILEWMENPAFMRLYRQRVLQSQVLHYARAVERIGEMLEDENPSVVQRAAHEALEQFEAAAMRQEANELVVRVEGMPEIGMPEVSHEQKH